MVGSFAGILRMLVQSELGDDGQIYVKLLPALPSESAWQQGSVKGICIKGNKTLDMTWREGKVEEVKFYPDDENVKII